MNVTNMHASEFLNQRGIEYFLFEEDFVDENVRCIPMIVRFKMDAVGIKLKLAEWSKFRIDERMALAVMPCETINEIGKYHVYLDTLVQRHTGKPSTKMEVDINPLWADLTAVPETLLQKAAEYNCNISVGQWKNLTALQRFALLKLQRPGHENKNFPIAMREFKLMPGANDHNRKQTNNKVTFGRAFHLEENEIDVTIKSGSL